MGKKHKKHHKSEKKSLDYTEEKKHSVENITTERPLKLVLKVGSGEPSSDVYTTSSPRQEEKRHKHKKKKKKKSSDKEKHRHHEEKARKREHTDVEAEQSMPHEVIEPSVKKLDLKEPSEDLNEELPPIQYGGDSSCLKVCVEYLHKSLQKKDTHGFFAYPVNDVIAPGYSNIIQYPMDFSTMLGKIKNYDYITVMEYKKDFVQMCNNAMIYNRPETIYFREAKKLVYTGLKLLNREKLLNLKKNHAFLSTLSSDEIGYDTGEGYSIVSYEPIDVEEVNVKDRKLPLSQSSIPQLEDIADDLNPDYVLAQVKAAAKEAANNLAQRSQTTLSFLRKRADGTTSMTVLNPENHGIVSDTEKVINLGALVSKLPAGTGSLSGFKEDKRNKAIPVNYLNYNAFSSYAPHYDSTFANITKDEGDLLLSTYSGETGVQYANSVKSFVEGAGDYAVQMVDNLLDILTGGEHSKMLHTIKQKQKQSDGNKKDNEKPTGAPTNSDATASSADTTSAVQGPTSSASSVKSEVIDYGSLRSLSDLGVDVSFVDYFEKGKTETSEIQQNLNKTSEMLQDLQRTQTERLSLKPPAHLSLVRGPTDREAHLADEVTENLKQLSRQVNPSDIVSVPGLRAAMGVTQQTTSMEMEEFPPSNGHDDESSETAPNDSEGIDHKLLQEFFQPGPSFSETIDFKSEK